MLITIAWLVLALIHAPPALATFSTRLRRRMYGLDAGPLELMLVHRGVLFLAVACACVLAAFSSEARIAAALVVSISVLGFLIAYLATGAPKRVRTVAIVDAIALIPLAAVLVEVWVRLSA